MVRRTKIDHAEHWKILCLDTEKQCFETRKKERKKKGELKSALKALIKGQEKKSSLTQMQSPSSSQVFRCGSTAFFG